MAVDVNSNTKHSERLVVGMKHMHSYGAQQQKPPLSPKQGLYSEAFIRFASPALPAETL